MVNGRYEKKEGKKRETEEQMKRIKLILYRRRERYI